MKQRKDPSARQTLATTTRVSFVSLSLTDSLELTTITHELDRNFDATNDTKYGQIVKATNDACMDRFGSIT